MTIGLFFTCMLIICCFYICDCFDFTVEFLLNWFCSEPRGFGFVKYRHGEDAAEAKQQLNHTIIGGREIRIVFAEENRKTPQEMRVTTHGRCAYSLI